MLSAELAQAGNSKVPMGVVTTTPAARPIPKVDDTCNKCGLNILRKINPVILSTITAKVLSFHPKLSIHITQYRSLK